MPRPTDYAGAKMCLCTSSSATESLAVGSNLAALLSPLGGCGEALSFFPHKQSDEARGVPSLQVPLSTRSGAAVEDVMPEHAAVESQALSRSEGGSTRGRAQP